MKPIFLITLALLFSIVFGCANKYKPVSVSQNLSGNVSSIDGVTLNYNYDVLKKRYNKKERVKKIRVVQVKIQNLSGRDLTFNDDIKIVQPNGEERYLLTNEKIYSELKQKPGFYLFYFALLPVHFTRTSSSSQSTFPIGLILGPGLAILNLVVASTANDSFKLQLEKENLDGRVIKDGETRYGLIGIEATGSKTLRLKISK